MINILHLLDTINIIPHDNTLYLLEGLSCGTGLFASNGDIIYIVPNTDHSTSLSIITEFLHLQTNVFISAFNVSLELPKPGTIIKGAKIILQSGMTINIPRITIKGLVLMAILYEGNRIQE